MECNDTKKFMFDKWQIERIIKKSRDNYPLAILLFEDYLKEYPYDYIGYLNYINMLLDIGRIEDAFNLYCKITQDLTSFNIFSKKKDDEVIDYYNKTLNFLKVRLLALNNDYDVAFKLYQSLLSEPDLVHLYLADRSGAEVPNVKTNSDYLKNQLIDYSMDSFLEHIQDHMYKKDHNGNCFSEEFPIMDIINSISEIIPNNKRFYMGILNDKYFFKYDECGYYQNRLVNYFAVATIRNTNQFITMFPCDKIMNLSYTDLNSNKNNILIHKKR